MMSLEAQQDRDAVELVLRETARHTMTFGPAEAVSLGRQLVAAGEAAAAWQLDTPTT